MTPQILKVGTNMKPTLQFSRAEFASRVDKTKRAMEKRGIDVLIVSDPSNMAWLTGYDGWSFYVHQAVVLPIDEDPVWFGRSQAGNGARSEERRVGKECVCPCRSR